ncbi:MAG TPA: hypothetical protein ENK18_02215 [Deltaproteobacteria bacterium]|nr:hypothetical protein [Deltaproteobacteria bacterium]
MTLLILALGCGGDPPSKPPPTTTAPAPVPTTTTPPRPAAPARILGPQELSDATVRLRGDATTRCVGANIAGAGDTDGDGIDDLLIGARCDALGGSGSGRAWLVPGGLDPGEHALLDVASGSLSGTEPQQAVGWFLDGAGDLDGDGLHDIVVGAPSSVSELSGFVGVIYGPLTDDRPLDQADAVLLGPSGGGAGRVVGDLDLTGDNNADLVISDAQYFLPPADPVSSTVWIIGDAPVGDVDLDTSAVARVIDQGTAYLGSRLAGGGDLDGDGVDDLILSSWQNLAYTLSGPLSGDLSLDDATSSLVVPDLGDVQPSFTGAVLSVGGGGDGDGDGKDDMLVAQAYISYVRDGRAWIVRDPQGTGLDIEVYAIASLIGETESWAGDSLAWLGDLDGDGFDDLAVGAPRHTHNGLDAGAVHLLYGPLQGQIALADSDAVFFGEGTSDMAGAVANVGDLDGDTWPDLAVGALSWGQGDDHPGAVYVVLPSAL